VELLDRAFAASRVNTVAQGQILLNKEFIFDQMGDLQNALTALTQATPFVEASGDERLLFALRFKMTNNLCQLGRFVEASKQLPRVRELAERLGNELDLIRLLWLEARVMAKQGRAEEAMAGLEQVRQDFTARGLPYDAALASLELAVLYLKEERTAEVRSLARSMSWIFQAQGIAREALAALSLFLDAAQRETATVEMTRHVLAELERMRVSTPLRKRHQRGRG
jgi:tetratricopeptide (TPR) repeat protein